MKKKHQTESLVVEIQNQNGLHARPSSSFVKTASEFQSEIFVEDAEGVRVNGKSILGLLMLAADSGSKLTITAKGPDAQEALKRLQHLVENKFGEAS